MVFTKWPAPLTSVERCCGLGHGSSDLSEVEMEELPGIGPTTDIRDLRV